MTYKGILAFEDNWPSKGDYDLNDVVVKYNSVLSFNTKNEVLSTKDTFTVLWSGASYSNSFIYQLNTDKSNVESSLEVVRIWLLLLFRYLWMLKLRQVIIRRHQQ